MGKIKTNNIFAYIHTHLPPLVLEQFTHLCLYIKKQRTAVVLGGYLIHLIMELIAK